MDAGKSAGEAPPARPAILVLTLFEMPEIMREKSKVSGYFSQINSGLKYKLDQMISP